MTRRTLDFLAPEPARRASSSVYLLLAALLGAGSALGAGCTADEQPAVEDDDDAEDDDEADDGDDEEPAKDAGRDAGKDAGDAGKAGPDAGKAGPNDAGRDSGKEPPKTGGKDAATPDDAVEADSGVPGRDASTAPDASTAGDAQAPKGDGGSPVTTPGGATSFAAAACPKGAFGNPLEGIGKVETFMFSYPTSQNSVGFTEGPVWTGGALYFSEHNGDTTFTVVPPATKPVVWKMDTSSNGITLDPEGNLLVAYEGKSPYALVRYDPKTGNEVSKISTGGTKPNDVIVRSDGTIYFTSPGSGVFMVAKGAMTHTDLKLGVRDANGIALSPDEKILYVSNVQIGELHKYAVADDGTVMDDKASLLSKTGATADGMAIDCAGNIYVGTRNGVDVFAPDGKKIGTIDSGYASNCTFGGDDLKTLYITSQTVLKSVKLAVPGLPN